MTNGAATKVGLAVLVELANALSADSDPETPAFAARMAAMTQAEVDAVATVRRFTEYVSTLATLDALERTGKVRR